MSQFPVAPITAPEQRGQSWLDELRKTSVSRSIVTLTAPLWRSAAPRVIFWLPKRLTRQTGTPAAKSGSGGPNVRPFTWSVAASSSVHPGVVLASQPVRHIRICVPNTTGKLCDAPVQPLSRSVPSRAIASMSSRGPPLGLAGHCAAPTFGIQRSVRRSGSFRGLPLDVATSFRRSGREGRGPRRPLRSASGTNVAGPHAAAEAGSGGG